jgi:hypothetical protein
MCWLTTEILCYFVEYFVEDDGQGHSPETGKRSGGSGWKDSDILYIVLIKNRAYRSAFSKCLCHLPYNIK